MGAGRVGGTMGCIEVHPLASDEHDFITRFEKRSSHNGCKKLFFYKLFGDSFRFRFGVDFGTIWGSFFDHFVDQKSDPKNGPKKGLPQMQIVDYVQALRLSDSLPRMRGPSTKITCNSSS